MGYNFKTDLLIRKYMITFIIIGWDDGNRHIQKLWKIL